MKPRTLLWLTREAERRRQRMARVRALVGPAVPRHVIIRARHLDLFDEDTTSWALLDELKRDGPRCLALAGGGR